MKQQLSPSTVVVIIVIVAVVAVAALYFGVSKGRKKVPSQVTPEGMQGSMDKAKMQQGAAAPQEVPSTGSAGGGAMGAPGGAPAPAPAPPGGQ